MPRCRFIDPTREVRYTLSDDDWIVIRRELTVGQLRDLSRSLRRPGETGADYAAYPTARVLAYLVAWSFVDAAGNVAPISAGAIDFLEPATLTEITATLDAHDAAIDQEKKRTTTNAIVFDPTLQSVGS